MRFVQNALAVVLVLLCVASTRISSGQETVLHSFAWDQFDGGYPFAGLLLDAKGNLFGTTESGGIQSGGTVFQLSPVAGGGWTEQVIHDFPSFPGDGYSAESTLIPDGKGNLFGTTVSAGSHGGGSVFELSPAQDGSWAEKVIYSFGSFAKDGIQPLGNLVFDGLGNLYGTTQYGGSSTGEGVGQLGYGTVFELALSGGGRWSEKVLYNFGVFGTDGLYPYAGLAIDSGGNLYGTTPLGGAYSVGTVFELMHQNDGVWTEKVLHEFNSYNGDGQYPQANLILDNQGNLFGTTSYGGAGELGTVFELLPTPVGAWTEQTLTFFDINNPQGLGANPQAGLTIDSQGSFYGTTRYGGIYGGGTVFKLAQQLDGSWTQTALYNFSASPTDGQGPIAGVIFDAKGNLYGMTLLGGTYGYGTVFEIEDAVAQMPVGTTTSLAADPGTNLSAGEPITLTATVTVASGPAIPTGTVTFADPAGGSVTVPVIAGKATYYGVVPPVGTYSVYVSYSGGPGFAASKSATIARTVAVAPPD